MDDVKKGYQTSEFWVTTVTGLAITLNQSGILGSVVLPIETITTLVGLVAAYVLSRSGVKAVTAKKASKVDS